MTATVHDLNARRPGPANSITTLDGLRTYTQPRTGEEFVSVTTGLDVLNKPGLVIWAANLAAQAALDQLPRLVGATLTPPCGNTYNRCSHDWRSRCPQCPCNDCPVCVQRWIGNRHWDESHRGKERGTKVHDVIEWWALHGEIPTHDDDIAPWVRSFLKFAADYQPEVFLSETTVLNRKHHYAGTLDLGVLLTADRSKHAADLCARFDTHQVRLYIDTKTTKKEGESRFYPEWALQLCAYRHAEAIMLPDGTEEPLSKVDGCAVLLLRPDDYALRPVVTDELAFAAFLCALNLYLWQAKHGDAATQVKSFPLPAVQGVVKAQPPAKATPAKKTAAATKTTAAARRQAVTERPMAERVLGQPAPHPDSPYGDEIPF